MLIYYPECFSATAKKLKNISFKTSNSDFLQFLFAQVNLQYMLFRCTALPIGRHTKQVIFLKLRNVIMKKMLTGIMPVMGLLLGLVFSASANPKRIVNWMKGPRQDIRTIIVVSNYTKSRLMADLIQNGSRQPYILLPAKGQQNIFFCPVNPRRPALQITEDNVGRFINFANPDKVIVIGDESYVPRKYLAKIDKKIPIVIIPVKDWNKAAFAIGELMNLPNLSSDYSRLNQKIEMGFYRPEGEPSNAPAFEIISSEDISVPAEYTSGTGVPADAITEVGEPKESAPEEETVRKQVSVTETGTTAEVSDDLPEEPVVMPNAPMVDPQMVEDK